MDMPVARAKIFSAVMDVVFSSNQAEIILKIEIFMQLPAANFVMILVMVKHPMDSFCFWWLPISTG